MEYQSFGRPMRAKGSNVKQALKMILVVAVCAWLVYQIKHSRNKTENYGRQTEINVEGYQKAVISLGRKGNPSWFDERRAFPDSGNVVDSADAEILSTGRDDDEFDVANEDKAEEEFVHTNDKFRTDERKEMEDEKSKKKVPIDTVREPPNEVQIRKNAEESVRRNASMTQDLIDESSIFHDENGVPPDGNENKILLFGQPHILHEDNSAQVKREVSISDATADEEEINTGTIHIDTSGINRSSEISEGESLVS